MFFQVKTSEEVQGLLKGFGPRGEETIAIEEAIHRIVSREITAGEDLPDFSRSSMDGYAVRAKDTFGATDSLPAFLELSGDVVMGRAPTAVVSAGNAVRISTGGMLPEGADAVVMLEYCHDVDEKTIEVSRAVAPMENVIARGDDFAKGTVVFQRGDTMRPQDIGVLAGLGIEKIPVFRRPKVTIISTGDEVIPIHRKPKPGQVRDINSYALSAFCLQCGAIPVRTGLCEDNFDAIREAVREALEGCDTVWLSGGSSVGARDMTVKVLNSFEGMKLLVHGIAISPGKPTIIAEINNKALFGLPGHAAAALIVAEVFLKPFLARISGDEKTSDKCHQYVKAELARNIESASGRDDYVRVKLHSSEGRLLAEPVFGKSGLISTLVAAQGLVKINRNEEGLYKGQEVSVMLFKGFEEKV
ncbi:MAG: molybdopterin molybdotransferase MoeA [Syntrophaceae bacterium]|nr:molybdopterin molybdotransferase MoeA [Syntrophaceae bacterium]HOC61058.1 molybdopterin molybdotransferase MoeA [Smithellaceae bacterium]HQM46187.1 molybdopterin molybdotransferase MoeA [Smithellaceae bacterium]